jgi:putative ATP-grasp target RiPP
LEDDVQVASKSTNPLSTTTDHFPLGRSFAEAADIAPAAVRPLGATLAVAPRHVDEVDMADVSYDPDRQIGVVRDADGRLTELAKHSTGWTTTDTASSDKAPGDADRDATED